MKTKEEIIEGIEELNILNYRAGQCGSYEEYEELEEEILSKEVEMNNNITELYSEIDRLKKEIEFKDIDIKHLRAKVVNNTPSFRH